ncbi:MAG TPA: gfo/Idh/MocA family oxidoreductase [Phycisphaerales bacterium]|nr:gfo/Idh/MocA family oxidoreductase [Phycisphaerales bacterium]HBR19299.1 gfo/Idh/MocA family oxidoreductase [Phycisphaerales bacterium]
MKTIKFGIIGCGLMGREFASAAARWCHLPDMDVKPEIVAICDASEKIMEWYTQNFSTIKQTTKNYKELLANKEVEAVYIAVPHNLHAEFYCAAIEAGKHLLGEKPFGIDKAANDKILATIKKHPEVFVRCSSESPFFPAVQRIGDMIEADAFGTILEVHSGFLHSSDLDVNKPINWKRMIEFNGEYGCMGDLGMHACHMPFKAGWLPINVRAQLSKIVKERPDGKGGKAPCKTWDNATLFCQAKDSKTGWTFPLTIKTHRIAPGNKNNWYLEIWGTKACARWSSKQINTLEVLEYKDGQQSWQNIDMGHEVAYKSITGGIFQMGFSDSILQMWAAFCYELIHGKSPKKFAGCVTPDEVSLSHRLFTAALESHRNNAVVSV